MYKGMTPIASLAAMKLLSRVSRRTKANIPSNMSINSSPCSSYCKNNREIVSDLKHSQN